MRRRGGDLLIEVCDTGPGIPQNKRAVIFREFERLEETAASVRGLGLGLSIVERIGRVLGHEVALHSVPGRGSIFSVRLPRVAPGVVEPAAPAVAAGRIAGLTVLCIDNAGATVVNADAANGFKQPSTDATPYACKLDPLPAIELGAAR